MFIKMQFKKVINLKCFLKAPSLFIGQHNLAKKFDYIILFIIIIITQIQI